MADETLKKLEKYGLGLVGIVALSFVAVILFGKIEDLNQSILDITKESLEKYSEHAKTIEELLERQQQRDENADDARREANTDRQENRKLILRILDRVDEMQTLIAKREIVTNLKGVFLMQAINNLAEAQGLTPVFPIADLQELQQKLQLLIEEDIKITLPHFEFGDIEEDDE